MVVVIAALAFAVFVVPTAASAFYLNWANAAIARAAALPPDAPDRSAALDEASADIMRAQHFSDIDRVAFVQARVLLARGAADVIDPSQMTRADPVTEYLWANAEWQANRRETAVMLWRRAGALTYFMQEAHRALDDHAWKRASDLATIATAIAPDNADAHYVLAEGLSRQPPITQQVYDELDRARALNRDPELLAAILSRRGEVLAEQDKWQDALDTFSEARRVGPVDARPRTGYALALLKTQPGERAEARELLTQVVDDSPWYTAAYVALSNLAETDGDVEGAVAWLQKGLAHNPKDARLLLPLGEWYARHGRTEEAQATLVLALENETHADALQDIAAKLAKLRAP